MQYQGKRTDLVLGDGEEVQDLGVVVDGLVEAAVVALYHRVYQPLYRLLLRLELQDNPSESKNQRTH